MLQIVFIAIIGAIIIVYLRSMNPELALLATISVGIILLSLTIKQLGQAFDLVNQLINYTGIDKKYYIIILKITAIGYLVEFGASIVQDFGLNSLANKLVFAGKIMILSISLPIIYAIINLVTGMLQ